ncbi:tight adherence protein B [Frigoribacterium sp. PhB160]|nr:tight adherence protein B [Frigoribacterium sp. PhB160]
MPREARLGDPAYGPRRAPADGPSGPRGRRVSVTPVATVVERVAVLLGAGVAPASAWRHVGEAEPSDVLRSFLGGVADAAARGEAVSGALLAALGRSPFPRARDGPRLEAEWRQVACAWRVAEGSGAPLGHCLRSFVAALREADRARREVEVALSGPRSAGRIVLALPPVGVLFSAGMGADAVGVLVGSPVGWTCLALGGALVEAARRWTARLVRSATPSDAVPGLRLELLSVAVSGGGAWSAAMDAVRAAVDESGCDLGPAEADADGVDVLDLSRRAGAPASELLRAAAAERRLEASTQARAAAGRLGSTLMLPLGACVLPAFLVVGVVPLVVSLVSSTASTL